VCHSEFQWKEGKVKDFQMHRNPRSCGHGVVSATAKNVGRHTKDAPEKKNQKSRAVIWRPQKRQGNQLQGRKDDLKGLPSERRGGFYNQGKVGKAITTVGPGRNGRNLARRSPLYALRQK